MIRSTLILKIISISIGLLVLYSETAECQHIDSNVEYTTLDYENSFQDTFDCLVRDFDDTSENPHLGWAGRSNALVVTDQRIYIYEVRNNTWRTQNYNSPPEEFRGGVGTEAYCMFWTDKTIYIFDEVWGELFSQSYFDPDEMPHRGYAIESQLVMLTNKRIYIHSQHSRYSNWKTRTCDMTDEQPIGGAVGIDDALIWTDRRMYYSFGFGPLWTVTSYEDSTETPKYGGMSSFSYSSGELSDRAYLATDKRIYIFYSGTPYIKKYLDSSEFPLGAAAYRDLAMVWTNKSIHLFAYSQVSISLQNGETPQGGGINQSFAHVRTDGNLYVSDGWTWNVHPYGAGETYTGGDITYTNALVWTNKRIHLYNRPTGSWDTSVIFGNDEIPELIGNNSWLSNTGLVRTNQRICIYDDWFLWSEGGWKIKEYFNNNEVPLGGDSKGVLAMAWTDQAAYVYDAYSDEWHSHPFDSTETPQGGELGDVNALVVTDKSLYLFSGSSWHDYQLVEVGETLKGIAVSFPLVMTWTDKRIYLCGFHVTTSINDEADFGPPRIPHLYQNYPNPFNPSTTIRFDLPVSSEVKLAIYDLNGQVVRQVARGKYVSGSHKVDWDGTDHRGKLASSGVYLYRLQAGAIVQERKMVLVR